MMRTENEKTQKKRTKNIHIRDQVEEEKSRKKIRSRKRQKTP